MLRKFTSDGIIALVAVGAGQANGGKELRISVRSCGPRRRLCRSRTSSEMPCSRAPSRPGSREQAAALKLGDKIRMVCVRYRGRKAELVKVQRLAAAESGRRE